MTHAHRSSFAWVHHLDRLEICACSAVRLTGDQEWTEHPPLAHELAPAQNTEEKEEKPWS